MQRCHAGQDTKAARCFQSVFRAFTVDAAVCTLRFSVFLLQLSGEVIRVGCRGVTLKRWPKSEHRGKDRHEKRSQGAAGAKTLHGFMICARLSVVQPESLAWPKQSRECVRPVIASQHFIFSHP